MQLRDKKKSAVMDYKGAERQKQKKKEKWLVLDRLKEKQLQPML